MNTCAYVHMYSKQNFQITTSCGIDEIPRKYIFMTRACPFQEHQCLRPMEIAQSFPGQVQWVEKPSAYQSTDDTSIS